MIAIDTNTIQLLFALLRCAIHGNPMTEQERLLYTDEMLPQLLELSAEHDVAHLLTVGLENNSLAKGNETILNEKLKALYRYEQMNYEFNRMCAELEAAKIPFIPLKGAIIRRYYPQPWMRTSCDIDILVSADDLNRAAGHLSKTLGYIRGGRTSHDVTMVTPQGIHLELHYDLVEEDRAVQANDILKAVWESAPPVKDGSYCREMTDDYLYFYHIAHMAKHFECGGCGIRPLIDLWLLDRLPGVDKNKRNQLLEKGGLLKFTQAAQRLSMVWMEGKEADECSLKMQRLIVSGGVYGSASNAVVIWRKNKGGRFAYLLSRIFLPYARLKRYYPVLEKHKWLMPVMQARRWTMLLRPRVAELARKELAINYSLDEKDAKEMEGFLNELGL